LDPIAEVRLSSELGLEDRARTPLVSAATGASGLFREQLHEMHDATLSNPIVASTLFLIPDPRAAALTQWMKLPWKHRFRNSRDVFEKLGANGPLERLEANEAGARTLVHPQKLEVE
jgi:hypothetical protein